jgi:hypothetical protein
VLKSPQHLEQFGPSWATFPDATFVVTHRDPVAVTVSMATMIAYTARMHAAVVDPPAIGRYWSARGRGPLPACAGTVTSSPGARPSTSTSTTSWPTTCPWSERIYDLADQPFTDDARRAMTDFMAAHRRGRHGTVVYQPEVLGIDRAERRRALAFYSDRFGVAPEE